METLKMIKRNDPKAKEYSLWCSRLSKYMCNEKRGITGRRDIYEIFDALKPLYEYMHKTYKTQMKPSTLDYLNSIDEFEASDEFA